MLVWFFVGSIMFMSSSFGILVVFGIEGWCCGIGLVCFDCCDCIVWLLVLFM